MSLQDVLVPGEKVLSECKPLYATSRRIIRYDERADGEAMAEIGYHQLIGFQLMRQPNHLMMILGTLGILAAIFLTLTGFIFITSIPALVGGAVLLFFGARGKLGYYQLHFRKAPTAQLQASEARWSTTIRSFMESLGLKTPAEEARWRLDYLKAGSFIATIRTIVGELPEM